MRKNYLNLTMSLQDYQQLELDEIHKLSMHNQVETHVSPQANPHDWKFHEPQDVKLSICYIVLESTFSEYFDIYFDLFGFFCDKFDSSLNVLI